MLPPVPRCKLCYLPIKPEFSEHGRCRDCHEDPVIDGSVLEGVMTATLYVPASTFPHTAEIKEFKSNGSHGQEFADAIVFLLQSDGVDLHPYGAIVPIPSSRIGEPGVGTLALAEALSDRLRIPISDSLRFKNPVSPQMGKSRGARIRDMRDTMVATQNFSSAVLIVDDVCTTGATMMEAARSLREAGALWSFGIAAGRDCRLSNLEYVGVVKKIED